VAEAHRDLGLRRHVMNAIARRMPGEKYRFDRPSRSRNERQQDCASSTR
jgi:hypothetical protein